MHQEQKNIPLNQKRKLAIGSKWQDGVLLAVYLPLF